MSEEIVRHMTALYKCFVGSNVDARISCISIVKLNLFAFEIKIQKEKIKRVTLIDA